MYYHTVEELNKQIIPQVQYLQSTGTLVPNTNPIKESSSDKVSTYFFPSMIFPTYIELVSITLLTKKHSEDKIISLGTVKDGSEKPLTLTQHNLIHKANNLHTTLKFKQPLILDPHQSFFFFYEGELKDSCVVLGYRNFTGIFGPKNKKLE